MTSPRSRYTSDDSLPIPSQATKDNITQSLLPGLPMPDLDEESIVDLDHSEGCFMTASDRIRALLNNGLEQNGPSMVQSENPNASVDPGRPREIVDAPIKEEPTGFEMIIDQSIPAQVITISDDEEAVIKEEDIEETFNWTSMPDETISISDSDDEDHHAYPGLASVDNDGSSVIGLGGEDEGHGDSGPILGKSLLIRKPTMRAQRTPQEIEMLREKQRRFMEEYRTRQNSDRLEGVPGKPFACRRLDEDNDPADDSWMSSDHNIDDHAGARFRGLKKSYKAKVKKDLNTFDDDVQFKKAEKEERLRLARLKAEYEDACGYKDATESDEGGEDEEGLFITPSPSRRPKRQLRTEVDDEDEEGSPQDPKQCRPNSNRKRTQEELEKERTTNMMAGIESFLHKTRAKNNAQNRGSVSTTANKKGRRKKTTQGTNRRPKKPTQAGFLANTSSLLTSNVFDDADANFNREALPISTQTHKAKALADLVASVPLADRNKVRGEKELIRRATITLGKRKVWPDGNGGWTLKGMASSLHHHQVLGAAFMKERETGGEEPLGGILAGTANFKTFLDAMGLGKTVMTLALMAANPPPRGEKSKCTLIVCAPSLLAQWEREIQVHKEKETLSIVLRHYSATRLSGQGAVYLMENADIILTTYQEVVKSYPRPEVPEHIRDEQDIIDWWEKEWDRDRDVLHKVDFYRVVLDESQAIKNHVTQTSIACRALQAKHRWALSGTPIMNKIEELYPYFKFLRTPFTGCYKDFRDNYCIPGSNDCNSRLHCLLDQIMCRRTLKDTVLGKKIVDLPKHNSRKHHIEFSLVEAAIYRRVFKKFVGALNKASAEGTLEKHPGLGLVAFLRLRQLCAHTLLVQEVLQEVLDFESIDRMRDEFIEGETPENQNDRDLLTALRRMLEAKPEIEEQRAQEPQHSELGKIASRFGKHLGTLKGNMNWTELQNQVVCQRCGDPPQEPMVTSCLHVYCKECLESLAYAASANDQDQTKCLECNTPFTGAESCEGLKELEFDELWLLNDTAGKRERSGKVDMQWVAYGDTLVLSSKLIAVRNQVEKWLEEEPDKKIVIFSQFHMIMQILERLSQQKKWKYCNYHGKMSHKSRDKTILDFQNDKETKIMIASLKCGGTGLNLTMASRCLNVDNWFNSYVEQQAFCRIFRIGQKSETFIAKFIVNKSADTKLEEMQLKKNAIIGRAMDDRSVMSKLTVNDILRLFGEVRLDRNKKPFVAMDDDEKLDRIFEKRDKK